MICQNGALRLLLLLLCTGLQISGLQAQQATPEEYLRMLPHPARDVTEATARCPGESDTSMQALLEKISRLADGERPSGYESEKMREVHEKYPGLLRKGIEKDIRAAGEQVDEEIQACPKVANEKGQFVYDATCVGQAELRGHRRRVAAVEEYLDNVSAIWPEYLSEVERLLKQTNKGKWHIVLRVAADVASITQMAGQFAR